MNKVTEKDILAVLSRESEPDVALKVITELASDDNAENLKDRIMSDLNSDKILNELEYDSIPTDEMWRSITENTRPQRGRKIALGWLVAATIIPLLFSVASLWLLNSRVPLIVDNQYIEVYAAKGERKSVVFQDGTEVTLDSDSRLRYPKMFSMWKRKVELSGQAFFDVAKDKSWGFEVVVNNTSIDVLGTQFNVEAYPEDSDIRVKLTEGSVAFSVDGDRKYIMSAGDLLTYNNSSGKCTLDHDSIDKSEEWVSGTIMLDGDKFDQVAIKLSRIYDVEFKVADPRVYDVSFNLLLECNSLEDNLLRLEYISNLRFENTKKGVVVVDIR